MSYYHTKTNTSFDNSIRHYNKKMFLIPKQYIGNLGIPGKIKAAPQALENAIYPKRFFNTLNDTCSSIFIIIIDSK